MPSITETSSLEDADFIIRFSSDPARAGDAMRELGYREVGGTYYHEKNVFTVEFPPGPLAIGADLVRAYDTVKRGSEVLHVITQTDCVRDRLAHFYFFADRSALAAAVAVARGGVVDLAAVRRWSQREREASHFEEFLEALSATPPAP